MSEDCGKKSYPGKASAERARKGMKVLGYDTTTLHTYYCRDCGKWHIGHAWQTEKLR